MKAHFLDTNWVVRRKRRQGLSWCRCLHDASHPARKQLWYALWHLVQYLPKYDFLSVLDPGVSERELARVVPEVVSAKMPCRWSSYFVMCPVR